mmetsp:Transcript_54673/g.160832  ORF Transcript_54673/g.160832 Transcript_54673/m.160832 type:complete len:202 (+) Transcript_54673:758-1363(+)
MPVDAEVPAARERRDALFFWGLSPRRSEPVWSLAASSSSSSCFSCTQRRAEPMDSVTAGDIWIRPALCLPSTRTAFFSMAMACTVSFSSERNSAASFSRMAVALARDSFISASSPLRCSIFVASSPSRAAPEPTIDSSSVIFASASSTAFFFSFSLVWHQHIILSYVSDSAFASVESWDFISWSSFTTRWMGVSLEEASSE